MNEKADQNYFNNEEQLMKLIMKLFFCLAIILNGATVNATPFTAFEKNVEAMNEAVLMTTSMLVQEFGATPATFTFSGTFGDSGWDITSMSGSYAGLPLELSFSGTFDQDLDQGDFTSKGTFGTASLEGSGKWNFMDVDAQSINMFWNSEMTILPLIGSLLTLDKHFTQPKLWVKTMVGDNFIITDYGKYESTLFGIPIPFTEKEEISEWVIPKDGPQLATITVDLPDDSTILTGSANFDTGTVGGTITVVPEPSTLFLFGSGLAGITAFVRKKKLRAKNTERKA
jgi:PEP-CTERM motif